MVLKRTSATMLLLLTSRVFVRADGADWVSPEYMIDLRTNPIQDTVDAEQSLIGVAGAYGKKGPRSVRTPLDQVPPSNNPNDYMSFAPYYWPDCNWCPPDKRRRSRLNDFTPYDMASPPLLTSSTDQKHAERKGGTEGLLQIPEVGDEDAAPPPLWNSPTGVLGSSPVVAEGLTETPTTTTAMDSVIAGTPDPALAKAKTMHAAPCSPSPTKSMPPSATWTSCTYKHIDGRANPDTKTLAGPGSINGMSQAVFFNAMSYAVTGTPSYSQKAVSFLETFFLAEDTAMTPNVNFGQIVRGVGPEHRVGTFAGVLDMRGMIKVANAILALKAANSPDWDGEKDSKMKSWLREYIGWLESSPIAKKTASSANNHATFFYAQLAAVKLLVDDEPGAQDALSRYFNNQFMDHIAASGEQPFEAVRANPYHYRCFNLEAMITVAKIGDYLGMDFWTKKTKNGATIQQALDFTMAQDPKKEAVSKIFPHVAAVAAAYGDPDGRYANFLQAHHPVYKSDRYWLYDQAPALKMTPSRRRPLRWKRQDADDPEEYPDRDGAIPPSEAQNDTTSRNRIASRCPETFTGQEEIELDNGVSVTRNQVRPFYVLSYPDMHGEVVR